MREYRFIILSHFFNKKYQNIDIFENSQDFTKKILKKAFKSKKITTKFSGDFMLIR